MLRLTPADVQVFYEFFVFRFQNKTITHALATALHFLIDAICCFVTCVFITEITKFGAGRLRPNFLQVATAELILAHRENMDHLSCQRIEPLKKISREQRLSL